MLGEQTAEEIEWWLDIVRAANAAHERLPDSIRAEINAMESPRELSRMVVHLAGLSTETRRRVEMTLLGLLGRELVIQPAEPTRSYVW